MFRLVSIEDTVQVPPRLFALDRFQALENEVNRKYANTVLSGVGVCVALWDFIDAEDDRLMPQSGFANTNCTFRLLVFAPVVGEVLWGYVHRVRPDGVSLDVDFMGGMFVSKADLPGVASLDEQENAWKIAFPSSADEENGGDANGAGEEAEDEETVNMLDAGNAVAFTVLKVSFTDGDDKPPEDPKKVTADPEPIMKISASMKDSGLGRYEWWEIPEEEEEGGDEEGYEEEGGYEEEEVGDEREDEEMPDTVGANGDSFVGDDAVNHEE